MIIGGLDALNQFELGGAELGSAQPTQLAGPLGNVNLETGQPLPAPYTPTWEDWASLHSKPDDGYIPISVNNESGGFSLDAANNLTNMIRYTSSPQAHLYSDVAYGNTTLNPNDFNKLLSNESGLISQTEFDALPPEVQAQARANPQLFLQSVMLNEANSQTNDLLSLNAQGGYSNFNRVTWDPNTGLKFNRNDYMNVDNGIDPGLVIMGLMAGGLGALAAAPAAVAGTGAAGAAGTTAADFALADAAQLAGQGLSQSQIASVMAANGIQGTGGAFLGTGGVLGTSGNAVADAALNGAIRGGLTSGIRGGDPLSGAVMGGVGGGWSNFVGDLGNPILNSAANAVPSAIVSGSATPILTSAVGGGLNQFGVSSGLNPAVSGALASAGSSVVGQALADNKPVQQAKHRFVKPKQAVYDPATRTVKLV